MAPVTFHLLALHVSTSFNAFSYSIRSSSIAARPLYVGKSHHWMHAPGTISPQGSTQRRRRESSEMGISGHPPHSG
ncbi:hypothetical protein BAUCODRAFT_123790 [Baudoinia panamericana UAMH 10762]|uniref:Uncharacterized protein n=1 Tax=Baudoinia panamericana (strain UAMH 10762) TaxID=717646 RepID=M2N8B1_BAUPA|nr:uncharacterized protein BAUCODRAFT_123790 [Baudoinia panamericana UAMH 10762]EMC95334.1 hypothetical protein BAUCODRAFT_123790 [Baudoinia panamericana UAMH 10762]